MSTKHWVTKIAHPDKVIIHGVVDWVACKKASKQSLTSVDVSLEHMLSKCSNRLWWMQPILIASTKKIN